jgi:hypothetical protein
VIRKYPNKRVFNDSEGGRSFFDVGNGVLYQGVAQRIASFAPSEFIYDLNVNDYFKAQWNATDCGTAQGLFFDYLRTLLPWTKFFMARGSPSSFGTAANAQGSTLTNYDTQLSTYVTGKPLLNTYVDTNVSPFPGATNVSPDGLHYNTDGQEQMGIGWLTTLGYI